MRHGRALLISSRLYGIHGDLMNDVANAKHMAWLDARHDPEKAKEHDDEYEKLQTLARRVLELAEEVKKV